MRCRNQPGITSILQHKKADCFEYSNISKIKRSEDCNHNWSSWWASSLIATSNKYPSYWKYLLVRLSSLSSGSRTRRKNTMYIILHVYYTILDDHRVWWWCASSEQKTDPVFQWNSRNRYADKSKSDDEGVVCFFTNVRFVYLFETVWRTYIFVWRLRS